MLKHEYIYFKLEFSYLKYQNAHYNMEVGRSGYVIACLEFHMANLKLVYGMWLLTNQRFETSLI